MGIYIKSDRTEVDTSEMPIAYLKNALAKAQGDLNTNNMEVLTEELSKRDE